MSKSYRIPDSASSASFSIDRDGETIEVTVYGVVYRAPASEGGGFYVEDVGALDNETGAVWELTPREEDRASEAILGQNS
jgi:hypothetical protein